MPKVVVNLIPTKKLLERKAEALESLGTDDGAAGAKALRELLMGIEKKFCVRLKPRGPRSMRRVFPPKTTA